MIYFHNYYSNFFPSNQWDFVTKVVFLVYNYWMSDEKAKIYDTVCPGLKFNNTTKNIHNMFFNKFRADLA